MSAKFGTLKFGGVTMNSGLTDSEQRKRKVIDTARQLFWDKGYRGTSMKSLAKACGFEPGNLYNYVKNKEELLYEVLREEQIEALELLRHLKNNDSSPTQRFHSLIKICISINLGHRRGSRVLFDSELKNVTPTHLAKVIEIRDAVDEVIRKIITDGKNSGEFAEMDEKIAGFLIASMFLRCRIWYSPKGPLTPDEIADYIIKFCMYGLCGPGGKDSRKSFAP